MSKDIRQVLRQIGTVLNAVENDKIELTDDEREFITNLSYAYQNFTDTTIEGRKEFDRLRQSELWDNTAKVKFTLE